MRTSFVALAALSFVLAAAPSACSSDPAGGDSESGTEESGTEDSTDTEGDTDGFPEAASTLPREMHPSPSPETLEQMRLGELAFAQELYGELTATEYTAAENLMISPYSLRTCFGMAWAAAVDDTEAEIAEVLRFEGQATTHEALNFIDLALAKRNDEGDEDNPPVTLLTNNRFFVHYDWPLVEAFLDVLAINYGAGVKLVDFTEGEAARQLINQWVEEQTLDRIEELLPEKSIKDLDGLGGTVAVLVNTLYLKAPWAEPFPENDTQAASFTLRDGSSTEVQMMHKDVVGVMYAAIDGYVLVDLPLRQHELSMTMILPPAAEDPALDAWFDPGQLQGMLDALELANIELRMPRFTLEGDTIALKEPFEALGMEAPFWGGFTNGFMRDVSVSNIYHQVFFAVDEAGVEGSAATAIVLESVFSPEAPPEPEYDVTFDRPFLTLVRDRETGSVLFMGRVTNPS